MTIASQTTFATLGAPPEPPGMGIQAVASLHQEFGPGTVQAVYDRALAAGRIHVPSGEDASESGGIYAQFASATSRAARRGLLDDSETILFQLPTGGHSVRTVFRFLETPRPPRPTQTEILRERIRVLEARVAELEARNPC